ncbi:MAG: chemotaxis-specific protein-glutamate methyltransferase CheB [Magnetococcales bacterium]|nr:chemotaxis-specific protein-glutamate methyltransferase CheB [Magnetococcales bacterium]
MIRVLLVDDSPVAILVLKKMLQRATDIEVVGTASNGQMAMEMLPVLKPDVMCTDLHMPKMDGLTLTRQVMKSHPLPILVISISVQSHDDHNVFELLEAGAIDVFPKPQGGLSEASSGIADELISKLRVLSGVVPIRRHTTRLKTPSFSQSATAGTEQSQPKASTSSPVSQQPGSIPPLTEMTPSAFSAGGIDTSTYRVVVVGASTGGPQALKTLFADLPEDFPLPIITVQHISVGFLNELVNWMNSACTLTVKIAVLGERPQPGTIYFPPEDTHLIIDEHGLFASIDDEQLSIYHLPPTNHRPSVDVLFHSVARYYKRHAAAIILTGMGADGVDGMRAICKEGGFTVAQNEESSVVFGMPQKAIEANVAKVVCSIETMTGTLIENLKSGH